MRKIKCAYCSEEFEINRLTKDHFIPKCLGGKSNRHQNNIVYCCQPCNVLKGGMHPNEYRLYLYHKSLTTTDQKFDIIIANLEFLLKNGTQIIRNKQIKIIKANARLRHQQKQLKEKAMRHAVSLHQLQ